ncbi:MAG TPA: hypothetical protein VK162_05540, partial [Streptosporangiaceae bacterium]|nr:hypothetical protein [Streptosporangiaceae bacterium]
MDTDQYTLGHAAIWPHVEPIQRIHDEARPARDEAMLIRALTGQRLQLADAPTQDRVFQVNLLADHVADLVGENGVVYPLGDAVVAGPVSDHRHQGCRDVTVVRHCLRPGVTVQLSA